MAQGVVRWAGETVAAVAAEILDIAMEALELIGVKYAECSLWGGLLGHGERKALEKPQ